MENTIICFEVDKANMSFRRPHYFSKNSILTKRMMGQMYTWNLFRYTHEIVLKQHAQSYQFNRSRNCLKSIDNFICKQNK